MRLGQLQFQAQSFSLSFHSLSVLIMPLLQSSPSRKGRGSEVGLRKYLNAFVVLLTVMSVGLSVAGFFLAKPILALLGTPDSMIEMATAYLRINFFGILFLFGYNFINTVFRSVGDSKTPIYFVLTAVLLNTILDPIFIAVLGWGVEGAAIATVVSQGVAFATGVIYCARKKVVPFSKPYFPARREVLDILKLGIPSGLQMSVVSAGVMAIMSVVASFGPAVVAGYGAAQRLDSLIMLPAQAIGMAVNSMAGQNIGAGKWDRVHRIAFIGFLYNLVIMFVIAGIVVAFARFGIGLFIDEVDAVNFGTDYLKMIAFFYPFLGINFVLNGVVRASGAMFQVLVLNIISFWVLRYPVTYFLSGIMGEKGIALGIGVSFVISSIVAFLYYRYGKWKKADVFGA